MSSAPSASPFAVFGDTVLTDSRNQRWAVLQTGTPENRDFVLAFCISEEERRLAQLESFDIRVRLGPGESYDDLIARIIRRSGYFLAVQQ